MNRNNYSVELVMEYNSLSPRFKKLIDFQSLGDDRGLYIRDDRLQFFPGPIGSDPITANTDFHVVLTTATGATGTNQLRFFEDDLVLPQGAAPFHPGLARNAPSVRAAFGAVKPAGAISR